MLQESIETYGQSKIIIQTLEDFLRAFDID